MRCKLGEIVPEKRLYEMINRWRERRLKMTGGSEPERELKERSSVVMAESWKIVEGRVPERLL